MSEFESISSFLKMIGFIKSLFWKNKNVVYINGNVKVLNVEKIRHLISPTDSKYINCQSKKSNKLFSYKWHFFKQKINLIQIVRNCMDSSKLTYCGFSSQMFSVFDGYILGDTLNYNFIELKANNQYYLIAKKINFQNLKLKLMILLKR